MATTESIQRSAFVSNHFAQNIHKSIPILPSSSALSAASDPMDATPSAPPPMGPPSLSSPGTERNTNLHATNGEPEPITNGNGAPAVGAAAAAQQPKVVQTAFIHKLYKYVLGHVPIHDQR